MVEYRNLMEDIVMQNLDAVISAGGGCTCDACKSDVAAYALNHLPPHYVATRQGRLLVKLKSSISEAAVLVSKSPRHGRS